MSSAAPTPKIAVIVLNWNGKADTLACLHSLTHATYPRFDIIVVDNGSTDGSATAILEYYPHCQLIESPTNLGFAAGNNLGIQWALNTEAEFLFLLNNDTTIAPDLFEHFVSAFQNNPSVGILGAQIFLFENREMLDHLGGMWNAKKGSFDYIGLRQIGTDPVWQNAQELDYVCGAGMMVRRQVFEAIGMLEPKFFLIWEESDFCMRAKRAGFLAMSCPHAKLWHKVSASFVGGKAHSTYFWWRNRLLWIERNCPLATRLSLYARVLLPEIFHMLKIRLIKKSQLCVLKWFKPAAALQEKERKLHGNRAALCGVRDYFLRRFGNGPAWIYTKK